MYTEEQPSLASPPYAKPLRRVSTIFRRELRCYCALAALAASFLSFSERAMPASTPMAPNTSPTPSHCMLDSRWPNATTESIIVHILRVTVTVTRKTDENVERA